jgi:hypothetical protein
MTTRELPIPPAGQRDASAIEMARVWIAEKGLHCSLNVGVYAANSSVDERKAWGIVLADLARHVAYGVAGTYPGTKPEENLTEVIKALLDELAKPSSEMTGAFVDKPESR